MPKACPYVWALSFLGAQSITAILFAHAFDDVQHFDGGLEGGFYLVHLQAARLDDVAIVVPSDVGHHQRVGAAVGWNAHRVVG